MVDTSCSITKNFTHFLQGCLLTSTLFGLGHTIRWRYIPNNSCNTDKRNTRVRKTKFFYTKKQNDQILNVEPSTNLTEQQIHDISRKKTTCLQKFILTYQCPKHGPINKHQTFKAQAHFTSSRGNSRHIISSQYNWLINAIQGELIFHIGNSISILDFQLERD